MQLLLEPDRCPEAAVVHSHDPVRVAGVTRTLLMVATQEVASVDDTARDAGGHTVVHTLAVEAVPTLHLALDLVPTPGLTVGRARAVVVDTDHIHVAATQAIAVDRTAHGLVLALLGTQELCTQASTPIPGPTT